jgi:hypothetical protein
MELKMELKGISSGCKWNNGKCQNLITNLETNNKVVPDKILCLQTKWGSVKFEKGEQRFS